MIDYFLYTDARLHWITASTLLPLVSVSSGNVRSSASVAYP
jgi:hypothetical protein